MSTYTRMINLMAREAPTKFQKMLYSAKVDVIAHLKAGDADDDTPNLHPESQEALDATQEEDAMFREALVTWKVLSKDERKIVADLLEESGWPDAGDDLYYDLTTMLPL